MKSYTHLQIHLLEQLSDGLFHSGQALGKILHVSRTSIWKQMTELSHLGFDIERQQRHGYRLRAPQKPLIPERIRSELKERGYTEDIDLHIFPKLESTNQFLKELEPKGLLSLCCAETQTKGRGRFGRVWNSPFGESIYCSSRWSFECDLSHLKGLSLVTGLAIIKTLNHFGANEGVRIKWPNDILWHHKKLCGILIEIVAESNGLAHVIIGIGLNTHLRKQDQTFKTPSCSLHEIIHQNICRNRLIACLIIELHQNLELFKQKGFMHFMPDWQSVDYLYGQSIKVSQSARILQGQAQGINENGELLLKDMEGTIHALSSGDATLTH